MIEAQLKKVKSTHIDFSPDTTHIHIPKVVKIMPEAMSVGNVYHIYINDSVVKPSANSTLASNWNGGKSPTVNEYFGEYLTKMGNMYKFNCTAVGDPNNDFFGWLPGESFEIIKEL